MSAALSDLRAARRRRAARLNPDAAAVGATISPGQQLRAVAIGRVIDALRQITPPLGVVSLLMMIGVLTWVISPSLALLWLQLLAAVFGGVVLLVVVVEATSALT